MPCLRILQSLSFICVSSKAASQKERNSTDVVLLSPKGQIPKPVTTTSVWKPSAWRPWPIYSLCRTSIPRPSRGVRRQWRKLTSTSEYFLLFYLLIYFLLLAAGHSFMWGCGVLRQSGRRGEMLPLLTALCLLVRGSVISKCYCGSVACPKTQDVSY